MECTEGKCHFYLKQHSNIYFAWCKTSVKILKLLNGNLFQPVEKGGSKVSELKHRGAVKSPPMDEFF